MEFISLRLILLKYKTISLWNFASKEYKSKEDIEKLDIYLQVPEDKITEETKDLVKAIVRIGKLILIRQLQLKDILEKTMSIPMMLKKYLKVLSLFHTFYLMKGKAIVPILQLPWQLCFV